LSSWYSNGEKMLEGKYKDGKKVDKWTYYNKTGSVKGVKEY